MLVVTLGLAGFGLLFYVSPQSPVANAEVSAPAFDLQGHRGARGLFPENSLPAFVAALEIGVTTLELDLGMTRDGVVVVHHDQRLSSAKTRGPDGAWLTDGNKPLLIEATFEELQQYDIGTYKPDSGLTRRFPDQEKMDGVRIPSLRQVIDLAESRGQGRIRYNVETKINPETPEKSASPEVFAKALAAEIKAAGLVERMAVQSFDWRTLRLIRELLPQIETVYLTAEQSWLDSLQRGQPGVSPWLDGLDLDAEQLSVPQAVHALGGNVWSPFFKDLRAADLAEAQRLGLRVVVYTVNEPEDMASLIDFGVDGIITDYPDRLRRVMAEKGLPLPPPMPAE